MFELQKRSYQLKFFILMIFLFFFVFLIGFQNCVYSHSNNPNITSFDTTLAQQLQNVLDNELASNSLMGISAAVIIPDHGTWLSVSGMSDPTTSDSINPEMLFSIGSITKTYTAALILKLAEEGLLTLEDPLHAWLPPYQHIDSTITLRQLLNHMSGIFSYTSHPLFFDSIEDDLTKLWTPDEILTTFINEPSFPPGSNWEYSNTNYILLGKIIKQATNSEVSTELRNRFFTPLNLNSTFLDVEEPISGELAHGWFDFDDDEGIDDMSALPRTAMYSSAWTAGALVATAEDVARWADALYGGEVLTQEYLDKMLTFVPFPDSSGYGLGAIQIFYSGAELWGHGGAIPGYHSFVLYSPKYDVSIATLVNNEMTVPYLPTIMPLLEVVFDFLQTTVVEEYVDGLPGNFELRQNYPNPFNPATTIEYSLSQKSDVILSIYNMLGQRIRTLANGIQTEGSKSALWDGKDNHGRLVGSGTYIYQLQTADRTKSKKMVLLR